MYSEGGAKGYDSEQDIFLPALHLSRSMYKRERKGKKTTQLASTVNDLQNGATQGVKAASRHDTSLRNICSVKTGW